MLNRKALFLGCALAVSAANCFAVSELNLTLSSDIVALDYANTNDDRGNQQARAFVGFQNITVKYDNTYSDKVKIDNGLNIGFELIF